MKKIMAVVLAAAVFLTACAGRATHSREEDSDDLAVGSDGYSEEYVPGSTGSAETGDGSQISHKQALNDRKTDDISESCTEETDRYDNAGFGDAAREDLSEVTSDDIYLEEINDFDRDGKPEGFYYTAPDDSYDADSGVLYGGTLYFISSKFDIVPLQTDFSTFCPAGSDSAEAGDTLLDFSDSTLFCIDQWYETDFLTYIYEVNNDEAVLISDQTGLSDGTDENEIVMISSDYDEYIDADGISTGHTWKPYWFYYKDGKIYEYGGIEMTQEDLNGFQDAAQIISEDTGENVWDVDSIYYRGNGIINVNFSAKDENGGSDRMFEVLRLYKGENGLAVKKEFDSEEMIYEGNYKPAVTDNVTYPEGLPVNSD